MYLYHRIPLNMTGDVLYPLNTLKVVDLELYNIQAEKYIGREHLMENKLPILNCLWNDVLHFSAVHPQLIFNELKNLNLSKLPQKMEYFEIDADIFDPEKTIIYLYKNKPLFKMREDNFEEYSIDNVSKYTNLPQETKEYYKECILNNESPLLYHKVPHVLYKGNLDTKNIKRIMVS